MKYITWVADSKLAWTIRASGVGADPLVDISARGISQEPMVSASANSFIYPSPLLSSRTHS